jgi:RNA recognition motif-containing protein
LFGLPAAAWNRAFCIFAHQKMSVKLFIGGFPLDMDELRLAQLVAPHGDIEVMKIVRDKRTGICKGFAFVEMGTADDAARVSAALDGEPMGDRTLSVKLAELAPPPAPVRYPKVERRNEPQRTLRPRRPRLG